MAEIKYAAQLDVPTENNSCDAEWIGKICNGSVVTNAPQTLSQVLILTLNTLNTPLLACHIIYNTISNINRKNTSAQIIYLFN